MLDKLAKAQEHLKEEDKISHGQLIALTLWRQNSYSPLSLGVFYDQLYEKLGDTLARVLARNANDDIHWMKCYGFLEEEEPRVFNRKSSSNYDNILIPTQKLKDLFEPWAKDADSIDIDECKGMFFEQLKLRVYGQMNFVAKNIGLSK